MKYSSKYVRAGCVALTMMLFLTSIFPQKAEAASRVIRVGFSDLDEMHQNEDGTYTGYVVDYLNEISKYTDWEYEYVFDSWGNCMDMVQSGELDLLGMTQHTPQREETFLFSGLSMAHDYTALYTRADSDIYYQEYEAINHCTVGIVEQTVHGQTFSDYADERGLTCQVVLYPTEEQALAALNKSEIDLLVTSGFSNVSGVKLIDQFHLLPAYFITRAGNQELMQELDSAMQNIQMKNSSLESELAEKYNAGRAYGLCLTREEQEYINSVGTITVRTFDGRRPLSYTDDAGSLVGMLTDYMDMLGKICGLTFSYEVMQVLPTQQEAELLEETGSVLLSGHEALDEFGLHKTNPVFEVGMSYIMPKDYTSPIGEDSIFAITNAMSFLEDKLNTETHSYAIRYYDSPAECMEAVIKGEADITIQYEYVAVYLLRKPEFSEKLIEMPGTEYVVDMSLFIPQEHAPLVSILNKALLTVTEEQRIAVVADAMLDHAYEYDFSDLLYQYGWWVLLVLALGMIALLCWILYRRMVKETQQKRENEELQRRLWLDEITGVYNRIGFFEHVSNMILHLQGDVCIVRVNIHHFKLVNELYGLEKGDLILKELGNHLKQLGKDMDIIVGRFSADRFYLCVASDDLEKISFSRQISLPWLKMDIALTYGIYPAEGQMDVPLNIMCDRADMANSSGGQAGEDYIYYYSDMEHLRLLLEQEIESEMERALDEEQFCIYIQPQYDVETEKLVGGEVLVRWLHPEKGLVPPNDFIGVFERNGFIRKLDYYVWEQCCRFLAQARNAGLPCIPLSVNVSRIHFYNQELGLLLTELVERHGLEPKDLELEVTETFCSEEPDMIIGICRQLREKGFKIAMDDFGSGYSSLNMLKEMPIDIIKMDLRFLSGEADKEQEDKGRNILRTLIELAHTLELQVVVEGVETKGQTDFIKEIGNCAAQGYYFSRPIPAIEFTKLLQAEGNDNGGLPTPLQKGDAPY